MDCFERENKDGVIEMTFDLRDTRVTVGNVPAKVCPDCGQEFVDGYVAENVNRLVDRVTEDVESYAKKVLRPATVSRQIAITVYGERPNTSFAV